MPPPGQHPRSGVADTACGKLSLTSVNRSRWRRAVRVLREPACAPSRPVARASDWWKFERQRERSPRRAHRRFHAQWSLWQLSIFFMRFNIEAKHPRRRCTIPRRRDPRRRAPARGTHIDRHAVHTTVWAHWHERYPGRLQRRSTRVCLQCFVRSLSRLPYIYAKPIAFSFACIAASLAALRSASAAAFAALASLAASSCSPSLLSSPLLATPPSRVANARSVTRPAAAPTRTWVPIGAAAGLNRASAKAGPSLAAATDVTTPTAVPSPSLSVTSAPGSIDVTGSSKEIPKSSRFCRFALARRARLSLPR